MFGLFKNKKKESLPQLFDLNNNPLIPGDEVEVLRYDMGVCKLIQNENSFYYESLKTGEQVSWLKMIDASSDRQKVKKIFLDK